MEFSIIIPTKDRGNIFEVTLKNVENQIKGMDGEVIVVNDSRNTKLNISNFVTSENIRLYDNPGAGVAAARNFGASMANSELLIFLDDDILITRESVSRILKTSKAHNGRIYLFEWRYPPELEESLITFQFGRYIKRRELHSIKGWLGKEWQDDQIFILKDGASYFLPISRSTFYEIGGYNEDYPHAGAEDFDFIQRAKKSGISFYLDKRCTVFHNEKDRIEIKNWLMRKKRDAETHRIALQMGYHCFAYHISSSKHILLKILSPFKNSILVLQSIIPNLILFDALYFRIIDLLFNIYYFEGYHMKRPNEENS